MPAWRKSRRTESRGARNERGDRCVLGRERDVGGGRAAQARARVRRSRRRIRVRPPSPGSSRRLEPRRRVLAVRTRAARCRVPAALGDRWERVDLRRASKRLRRSRSALRPRSRAAVPDGSARAPRGLRAGGRRIREAHAVQRDGVPAQGAHVRALLVDHAARPHAAAPRTGLPRRDHLASSSALRERDPARCRARRERGATRAERRLSGAARLPARTARCGCGGGRPGALLRPCHVGDARVARQLPPPRCTRDLGRSRGNSLNRAADLAIAGVGLAVAAPVLGVAAIAVKLEDGGPVFYRQTRVGKDGADFELLKLRTMVVDAEQQGAGYAVNKGDSRITRVGRILRRLSLDELPQLWNVVRGEMSIIGPRPTLRYQVERYDNRQRRRLDVKPGITGWAQIHGRAKLPWAERIELDVWYVDHRSPKTDVLILLRTPLALFGGTYKGATGGWRD